MTKRLALILILILGVAAIGMAVAGARTRPFIDQPVLVFILNLIFVSLVLFLIALFAARSYLATGLHQMLWLGAGSLAFGLGSLFYGLQHDSDPNAAMTAYCLGALIAGIFYNHRLIPWPDNVSTRTPHVRQKLRTMLIYYLPVGAGLVVIDILALTGFSPVFYSPVTGSTLLNDLVITVVIVLFLIAFVNNQAIYYSTKSDFFYWFSLALLLMALGLLLLVLTPGNSLLSWLGRIVQYIGGLYFLGAILNTVRQARTKKIDIETAVASFFRDPRRNYELLLNSSGDAVIAADGEGRILMWNPAAEKTFGYSRPEVIALDVSSLFDTQSAEYLKTKLNDLRSLTLDSTIIAEQREMNARRKKGEVFPVSITFSARRTPEGWMVIVIARDITEIKQAREAVIKTNQALEARVKERTAALEVLNEQLRLMTSKQALSEEGERKRIATELHDNVSQMLAVCRLELDTTANKSPDELKEKLGKILNIIQKLSDETQALIFQLSPPILYDLGLEPAIEELAVLFEQKNDVLITVDWDGQPALLSIEIKIVLFQLLRELFSDIVKYSRASNIRVSFSKNGEFEVLLEDDGVGFDPQTAETLEEGNGFRLRQLGERMRDIGGSLEIQANPGKGTRVMIRVLLKKG